MTPYQRRLVNCLTGLELHLRGIKRYLLSQRWGETISVPQYNRIVDKYERTIARTRMRFVDAVLTGA